VRRVRITIESVKLTVSGHEQAARDSGNAGSGVPVAPYVTRSVTGNLPQPEPKRHEPEIADHDSKTAVS
jgi:hypothetical protein